MEVKYRIYKVSTSEDLGYDSYSEFIVVALNETDARNTHPGSGLLVGSANYRYDGSWVEEDQIKDLEVEEIGYANKSHQSRQVLVASFNAG